MTVSHMEIKKNREMIVPLSQKTFKRHFYEKENKTRKQCAKRNRV